MFNIKQSTMGGCRHSWTVVILASLLSSLTGSTSLNTNTAAPSINSINIQFLPSQVKFQEVSQSYPVTLGRRLFSSVPRREFALQNVSLSLQSELILLSGASSSGKSALMKIVSGVETPVQGSVHIQCQQHDDFNDTPPPCLRSWMIAQPIHLEQRPSVDSRRTVRQILSQNEESIIKKLQRALVVSSNSMSNNKQQQQSESSSRIFFESVLNALTAELCSCFDLSTTTNNNNHNNDVTAWMDQTPLQLSPSENYRLHLVTACLQSSTANLVGASAIDIDDLLSTDDTTTLKRTVSLPAPILLLDEWMDTEPTEIVQTVQRGLEQLAKASGAVIISATHKADRWKKPYSEMVLSRGKVLSWNRI
jgi:ABC-type lipoprotein export system ATPase subunit